MAGSSGVEVGNRDSKPVDDNREIRIVQSLVRRDDENEIVSPYVPHEAILSMAVDHVPDNLGGHLYQAISVVVAIVVVVGLKVVQISITDGKPFSFFYPPAHLPLDDVGSGKSGCRVDS